MKFKVAGRYLGITMEKRGKEAVKLNFSCCATLFSLVVFFSHSPCSKLAVAPFRFFIILNIYPFISPSYLSSV